MTLPCSPGLDKIIPSREEKIAELRRDIAENGRRERDGCPCSDCYEIRAHTLSRLRRQLSALTGEDR